MKSLKTKVIMSAIVLVFALIATIGSTYAWFTVSNVVTVNTVSITVESSESLLIKVWNTGDDALADPGDPYSDYGWTLDDFSSVVTLTDSPYYASYESWKLLPVTALASESVAGLTDYTSIDITALRYLTSATAADRPLAAATANNASGHFLELKFWLLRPAGDNMNIYYSYTLDGTYEDAMFIGIIGDDDADDPLYTVFGNDMDYAFAWTASDAGFHDDATDSVVNLASITSALTAITGAEGTTSVHYLETANVPELVTVRVWLEGWDADANNAVMGATFELDMSFILGA